MARKLEVASGRAGDSGTPSWVGVHGKDFFGLPNGQALFMAVCRKIAAVDEHARRTNAVLDDSPVDIRKAAHHVATALGSPELQGWVFERDLAEIPSVDDSPTIHLSLVSYATGQSQQLLASADGWSLR